MFPNKQRKNIETIYKDCTNISRYVKKKKKVYFAFKKLFSSFLI